MKLNFQLQHVLGRLVPFLFLFFSGSWALSHEGHSHHQEAQPTPILDESIYNLQSKWTNQDGKVISLSDLRGKPVVISMVYTNCEHACPVIVEDMKKLEKGLSEKSKRDFLFALFSVDPTRDTPARLRTFAQARKLNLNHWSLFHGDAKAVRELAAVLGIRYKRLANGDYDHSNVITLLDEQGLINYQQVGLNQDPKEFLQKARELQKKPL